MSSQIINTAWCGQNSGCHRWSIFGCHYHRLSFPDVFLIGDALLRSFSGKSLGGNFSQPHHKPVDMKRADAIKKWFGLVKVIIDQSSILPVRRLEYVAHGLGNPALISLTLTSLYTRDKSPMSSLLLFVDMK